MPKALMRTSRINQLIKNIKLKGCGALEKVATEVLLSCNLYCNLLRGFVKMRQSLAEVLLSETSGDTARDQGSHF